MLTATELKALLKAHGLRLRKRLGQHYLIDPSIAAKVVDVCRFLPDDQVIEIGAGLGALTERLATMVKRVVAVEVDRAIGELLKTRLVRFRNVEIRCQDILQFPWEEYPGWHVIGTIPYQITSPILIALCEQQGAVAAAWLAMQEEVARRLAAVPGTKAYGRLTVMVQYRFEVTPLLKLSRHAFFPPPRVASTWVRLTARPAPAVAVSDETLFFNVVRAAFSQRRKTLLNCLGELARPHLAKPEAAEVLRRVGLQAGVRGETLSLAAFAQLTAAIQDLKRVLP